MIEVVWVYVPILVILVGVIVVWSVYVALKPYFNKNDGGMNLLPPTLPRPVIFDELYGDCEVLGSRLLDGEHSNQVLLKKGNNTFVKTFDSTNVVLLSNPFSSERVLVTKNLDKNEVSRVELLRSEKDSERQRRIKQDKELNARFEEIGEFMQKFIKVSSPKTEKSDEK